MLFFLVVRARLYLKRKQWSSIDQTHVENQK